MLQNTKFLNFEKFLSFLIIFSFSYSVFYNLIFFDLSVSPDYEYYISYIETFFNIKENTDLDQGLIYHFFIALVLTISENSINGPNIQIYISNSIHLVNNLLFLIGLIGVNQLLKFYKTKAIDRKLIVLATIFIPFITQARFHYKPEIFAIAFIPWILLNYFTYQKTKDIKHIFISITLFVGTGFLKGNIFVMLGLLLFFLILNDLKKVSLQHIAMGIVYFFAITIPLVLENQRFNGSSLFRNTKKRLDSEVYENVISIDFFTNFSFYKFIRKPNFDPENVNFFSTVLIDTFNDFFGVSWNIDHFPMSREYYIFENWILNGLFNYAEYYLSFVLSILFYLYIIYSIIKKRDRVEVIIYLAPFIGLSVLLINSLGFPFKNFDPSKGDTFKSIYFSFLLFISFIYISKNIFLKLKMLYKVLFVFFLISFNIFSLGINTEIFENDRFVEQRSLILQHTPLCKVGNILDFNIFDVDCNPPSDSCGKPGIPDNYTKKLINQDGTIKFFEDEDGFGEIYLLNKDIKDSRLVKGFDECYHFQELGYTHPFRLEFIIFPVYNLFIFLIMIFSIFISYRINK